MSDLHDGSDFDPTFGVGTDSWVQEQLDVYRLNHADDGEPEPHEEEGDELRPLCYCGFCNGFHPEAVE